jgi:hypothetical protein
MKESLTRTLKFNTKENHVKKDETDYKVIEPIALNNVIDEFSALVFAWFGMAFYICFKHKSVDTKPLFLNFCKFIHTKAFLSFIYKLFYDHTYEKIEHEERCDQNKYHVKQAHEKSVPF